MYGYDVYWLERMVLMGAMIESKDLEFIKNVMGDRFGMMLELFIQDGNKYIRTIKEGLAENDVEKIRSPAHTIKSSAKQIGIKAIYEAAEKIEEVASQIQDQDQLNHYYGELSSMHEQLRASMEAVEPELRALMTNNDA
tara:strand:+ start:95 stop:511 length:417 start_codon:yes stop_codon:yes gene_type:complete